MWLMKWYNKYCLEIMASSRTGFPQTALAESLLKASMLGTSTLHPYCHPFLHPYPFNILSFLQDNLPRRYPSYIYNQIYLSYSPII